MKVAEEREEVAFQGPDAAVDAAVVAESREEVGSVLALVGSGVGGGEHFVVVAGDPRDGVGVVDAEPDALGNEAGEGGDLEVVAGGALFHVEGETIPVFGEGDLPGIEAVLFVVARSTALAFRGAGAGGLAGVGAVGGEALFGEGEFGHGYLRRFRLARWRLVDWKERLARVRSERALRKAGSSWSARQARTVRMWRSTLG